MAVKLLILTKTDLLDWGDKTDLTKNSNYRVPWYQFQQADIVIYHDAINDRDLYLKHRWNSQIFHQWVHEEGRNKQCGISG